MLCYRAVIFVLLTKHCNAECFIDAYAGVENLVAEYNISYGSSWDPRLGGDPTKPGVPPPGALIELIMDIKYPPKSSSTGSRPAIVLIHGGNFLPSASKESGGFETNFQNEMATRGFVAASINYREENGYDRVFVHGPKAGNYRVLRAVEDARAAIRYIQSRSSRQDLFIDTAQIAIGGDSAGAITALFLAYAPEAQYEGTSGHLESRFSSLPDGGFHLAAVVSISGCMDCFGGSSNYIGTNGANTPLVVVHGTADPIFPLSQAVNMNNAANSNMVECLYVPIEGGGHDPIIPWSVPAANLENTKSWLYDQGPDASRTYFQNFMAFMVRVMRLRDEQCPRLGRRVSEDLFV